jgi:hypothetical protein
MASLQTQPLYAHAWRMRFFGYLPMIVLYGFRYFDPFAHSPRPPPHDPEDPPKEPVDDPPPWEPPPKEQPPEEITNLHRLSHQNSIDGPRHESSRGRARANACAASHHPSQALRPGRRRQKFSSPLHLA